MFNLNPLDILNCRELKTIPPHFAKAKLGDLDFFDRNVPLWIKNKLKGRFCVVRQPALDSNGVLKTATIVAFEDQKELTYFMLACPFIRRK